jgi:hypothetical protein
MFGNGSIDEDNMTATQVAEERDRALEEFAAQIHESLYKASARFAEEFHLPADGVYAEIVDRLVANLPQSVKNAGDGRATAYRVRLLLFKDNELMADSDSELPLGAPGQDVMYGLQAVGVWARVIAEQFHEHKAKGLDDEAIAKSIKSLRPSLSRNNGVHNWRMKYDVDDQSEWMANILVVTEKAPDAIS